MEISLLKKNDSNTTGWLELVVLIRALKLVGCNAFGNLNSLHALRSVTLCLNVPLKNGLDFDT